MHCKHPVFSVHNQPVHLLYLDIKLCLRCFKLPPNNSCQVRRLKFMDRAGGDLYIYAIHMLLIFYNIFFNTTQRTELGIGIKY